MYRAPGRHHANLPVNSKLEFELKAVEKIEAGGVSGVFRAVRITAAGGVPVDSVR